MVNDPDRRPAPPPSPFPLGGEGRGTESIGGEERV